MRRGLQGHYVPITTSPEPFKAFIPHDLPPDPPLALDNRLNDLLERANRALGRLDGIAMLLPDVSLYLYFFIRKEAVLSSQIEGTRSSLSDLLLFESDEMPGIPLEDVTEVSNYVSALYHGLSRIRQNAPLTSRLFREMHAILLSSGRGSQRSPGEFRRSQNWIGGTRPGNALVVPPPHDEVIPRIAELEKFLHDTQNRTPALIKAALAHVQFETIHPFQDGNGRLGRMLVTLLLCYEGALQEPLLYLSLYFKRHRGIYYLHLQNIRTDGDWEAWLAFFLEGVEQTSQQAVETSRRILALFDQDRERVGQLGRAAATGFRIHLLLQKRPLLPAADAAVELGISRTAATNTLERMAEAGIVRDAPVRSRKRVFAYQTYLDILSEGMEPVG